MSAVNLTIDLGFSAAFNEIGESYRLLKQHKWNNVKENLNKESVIQTNLLNFSHVIIQLADNINACFPQLSRSSTIQFGNELELSFIKQVQYYTLFQGVVDFKIAFPPKLIEMINKNAFYYNVRHKLSARYCWELAQELPFDKDISNEKLISWANSLTNECLNEQIIIDCNHLSLNIFKITNSKQVIERVNEICEQYLNSMPKFIKNGLDLQDLNIKDDFNAFDKFLMDLEDKDNKGKQSIYLVKKREVPSFIKNDREIFEYLFKKYCKFMELKQKGYNIKATTGIDYIWHIHMLSPLSYFNFCMDYFGKVITHEHSNEKSNLKECNELWMKYFHEEYIKMETECYCK